MSEIDLPVADPGVGDLVPGLVLGSTQVEQQPTALDLALVVVGDRGALAVAVGAVDDRVLDAVVVAKVGGELEVDEAVAARVLQGVHVDGVAGRRAVLGAGVHGGRGRKGDRGEEDSGESGEQHLD